MDTPLRFTPFLRPMVWGGRRLEQLGKALPTSELYGEAWEISDHPVHRSRVAAGPLEGQSLRQLMEKAPADLLGSAAGSHAAFPWLVKFLDCSDWLSVQVHPDESSVRRLWPGEGSKTEAWFVLAAEPGSRIYAGLLSGVTENDLRDALTAGRVADCLYSFTPTPGDCVFLPAGTVHAIGGGVLLAEVQQTSDATFRLFDWNRRDAQGKSRTLHVEQALACIDWVRGPIEPVRTPLFRRSAPSRVGTSHQMLVECAHFRLEFAQLEGVLALGGDGKLRAVIGLEGSGRWSSAAGEGKFKTGQSWLLPASLGPTLWHPDGSGAVLLCTLP
jgi:mannose-6-phosphate isomerase